MSEAIYHQEILALAREGRAVPRIHNPTVSARVDNPLCGDRVTIDLILDDERISAVGAKVQGCALCQAVTAVIAESAVGHSVSEVQKTADAVEDFLAGGEPAWNWSRLASFAPVRDAKSRWECVMLPFRAVLKALAANG